MAHSIIKGIDRMASTRTDTVWHADETLRDGRLVQVVASDPESTLLDMGAIVWPSDADNDVHGTVPLQTADGRAIPIDSHVAAMSRSGRVLGIVGSTYGVVPFKVIFTEWLLALARAGGNPETLGTYDAGRSFFSSVLVAPEWRVPGDDSVTRPLISIISSHGGGSIMAKFTTIRVVCKNTSGMFGAEHAATKAEERVKQAWVSVPHTSNAIDNMREAVQWITDGRARAEQEQAMLARLAARLVTPAEIEGFMANYIEMPANASKRTIGVRTAARDKFIADMQAADLGDHGLTGKGITAYGLYQAVTHFEDWTSTVQSSDDAPVGTRRALRAFLGTREKEKATARDFVAALAG